LLNALERDFNIIYIDETSFTREIGVKRGYGPKGKKVIFRNTKPLFSIGMLAATSSKGFEGVLLRNGANNQYSFVHFIRELLAHLKKKDPFGFPKTLIYMDNATYHTAKEVSNLMKSFLWPL